MYSKPGNNHKKEDYVSRIPVQIKGCKNNRTKRRYIKYSVNVNDLKNFLKEGGTIFFVVYFDANGVNEKIYYKSFLPYDLISLIERNRNKKSCSIKFKPFPDEPSSITEILKFFAKHKEMQSGIRSKEQLISFDDLSKTNAITELKLPLLSNEPIDNPFSYYMNHEGYIYATTPVGINIPVDHFDKITIAQKTHFTTISIGDTVYYNSIQIQYVENGHHFFIGKSISITIIKNENKMKIDFRFRGTLSERILAGEFMQDLINNKGFLSNGNFIPFNPIDFDERKQVELQQKIELLKNAREALQYHDVTEELNMDNLCDSDYRMLNLLVEAYNGNEVNLYDVDQPFGFIKIGNLNIIIITTKNDKTGLYSIYNYYEPKYVLFANDQHEKMHLVPFITALNKDDLLKCSNFNIEKVLKEFTELKYDIIVSEYVTLWLLELIKAYDSSNKRKQYLLEAAQRVVESIEENDAYIDRGTLKLNKLQIIKRQRKLTFSEKSELFSISNETKNIEILIGAYILLDEIEEAIKLLQSLPEERKHFFMEYPIYEFVKTNQ